MRISSSYYQSQWLAAIQRQQVELGVTQGQINTGRRIATAADDPAGAAHSVLLQRGIDDLANFQANAETARRRLSLAENSLSQATDVVSRLRELSLQAINATQTVDSRRAIAVEARELRNSLVSIGNAQDGEGRYLYAGNKVQTQPFVETGNISYQGDDGTRFQRISDDRGVQENDAGSDVFMRIRDGNGTFTMHAGLSNGGTAIWQAAGVTDPSAWVADDYAINFTAADAWEVRDSGGALVASGAYVGGEAIAFRGISVRLQGVPEAGDAFEVRGSRFGSVFDMVDGFIAALDIDTTNPAGKAELVNRLGTTLQDLDQALGHFSDVRSQIGARLSTIERQIDNNADTGLELTRTLSGIRDLDYAEAVSRLNQQYVALQAAQQSLARVGQLSLFDYL